MGNRISGQWRTSLMLALAAAQAVAPMAFGQMFGTPTTHPTTMATTAPSSTSMVKVVPGDGLLLNFKDASIDSVLDQLSAVAGFIVVRQTSVSGRITLESKQPVSREEAVSLLNTVLNTNGYAAIQMGRILKIMSTDAAKKARYSRASGE